MAFDFNVAEAFSLKGRIALVTGAASGMGEQFAHTLAAAGATVICASRRTDRIEKVAADIVSAGGQAVAIELDVGDSDSVKRVFDQAQRDVGLVDVLVNCAGQLDFAPFIDITDEGWNNLVNVNLTGMMRMCREFARRLIAAGKPGSIVNITSTTGMQVMQHVTCYGSVKAATNQLTRQIAAELFDKNIRCNAIAPGYFMTEMSEGFLATDAGKAVADNLPTHRVGNVRELSGALLLLASEASSFINGVVLPVDAGQVIQLK